MLWLVIYCILSVIIARWLEKRMKIAALFHSVMFIIMLSYLLILSDFKPISGALSNIFGDETYNTFKGALLDKYRMYSSEISVFILIEGILLVLSIVVVVYAAFKLVEKIISIFKKKIDIFKEKIASFKYILVEWRTAFKIYLKFCRLRN